jgi:hypothetical protein
MITAGQGPTTRMHEKTSRTPEKGPDTEYRQTGLKRIKLTGRTKRDEKHQKEIF